MNAMLTLYCCKCKADKPRFLFVPSQQKKPSGRYCISCLKKIREEMKARYGTLNPHNWIMAEGR